MPRQDPADRGEDVTFSQPGRGSLWAWASDDSRWVNSNFFIRVLPKINTNSITTFPTPKVEVPITLSPSINGSARLVSFCDEPVVQTCTTYCEIFWPYSYCQQLEMFHPSAVGVCQFIHSQDRYFLSGVSPKCSGK